MNTKILENEFEYSKPGSLEEVLETLATKQNVRIFAGGTDLIVKLKLGALPDMEHMLDINGVEELGKIETRADGLEIFAGAKLWSIESDRRVEENYPALREAIQAMASISVRNMATLGGNFCNASPVADAVGPVMCYGGKVRMQSKRGAREVNAVDFFLAPGVSVLEKGELLTSVYLPAPKAHTGHAFVKMGRVKSDIAKISITAVLEREGDRIASCRLAMGSVAARPLFLKAIGEGLAGKAMTEALAQETAQNISDFIKPIGDNRTTAEYRTDVAKVIARDALVSAWKNSGGTL
ncbi:MAG: xanthine dehydrogenase family protein subunit M [Christensenellaceae bacterium]|jgi:carbon-monoxide dehydrogenase medium subunit|nr:xanthine dehydrogenase family protein subunit M [Christensenellaceae bacterium]